MSNEKKTSVRKKLAVSFASMAVLAAVIMAFAFTTLTPMETLAAQTGNPAQTSEEMRQEIEELRALINLLVQSMNNNGNQATVQPTNGQAGIPQISSQRARDIAVELVGHGTARDVTLFTESGVLTFEVEVRHNNIRYMVYVNAANGGVIRMSRHEDGYQGITTLPEVVQPPAANTGGITIGNVVPRAPARQGGPANPTISAQRAVELARDHLVANGVTNARFDYVYMDIENGVWVWSVEFDGQGRSFEFYVNVNTGAFVRTPSNLGAVTAPAAPAQPPVVAAPAPTPAPAQQQTGNIPPGVNRANFDRNVRRWGPPPANPTRGTWWGSSYVWDGHRWNSSLS